MKTKEKLIAFDFSDGEHLNLTTRQPNGDEIDNYTIGIIDDCGIVVFIEKYDYVKNHNGSCKIIGYSYKTLESIKYTFDYSDDDLNNKVYNLAINQAILYLDKYFDNKVIKNEIIKKLYNNLAVA